MKQPAVCILASGRNGCLYTGVSSKLVWRVWQHREHLTAGFTDAHEVSMLVYDEHHDSMQAAITREKQIKRWRRAWKLRLIEASNPCWRDLWPEIAAPRASHGRSSLPRRRESSAFEANDRSTPV